jgi:hypothetical protein
MRVAHHFLNWLPGIVSFCAVVFLGAAAILDEAREIAGWLWNTVMTYWLPFLFVAMVTIVLWYAFWRWTSPERQMMIPHDNVKMPETLPMKKDKWSESDAAVFQWLRSNCDG